jgi:hypothetical protein
MFSQGGFSSNGFCKASCGSLLRKNAAVLLLYHLDSPADPAFVVDGLAAVGGAHPGTEADFARPLDLRNLMWVMHDALSRYPLWLSRFPSSQDMIPARSPLDKRFLRPFCMCEVESWLPALLTEANMPHGCRSRIITFSRFRLWGHAEDATLWGLQLLVDCLLNNRRPARRGEA